jgi:hypothetical protein
MFRGGTSFRQIQAGTQPEGAGSPSIQAPLPAAGSRGFEGPRNSMVRCGITDQSAEHVSDIARPASCRGRNREIPSPHAEAQTGDTDYGPTEG